MAGLPLLEDLPDLEGRRVLVRVDFNVPLHYDSSAGDPEGVIRARIEDDFRLRAAMPTIGWLLERSASVTACTHLDRPRGRFDPRLVVAPLAERLAELAPGVELMENLRFDPGEEANDPAFVDALVKGFDAYVNDAFGVCHRSHGSVVGPPARLPSAAGRLVQKEVEVLGGLLVSPRRPFVAVVGGSKVADKLGVLESLLRKVDRLLVGGGMAFTFLAARGLAVGGSLLDEEQVDACRCLMESAGDRLMVPTDSVVLSPDGTIGSGGAETGRTEVVTGDIPDGWRGLDIGPATRAAYADALSGAATILWNGPMGVCEDDRFTEGTRHLAEVIASSKAYSVVGGGDSVAALDKLDLFDRVSYVSTGGGASLELLEFGDLPGLDALRHAPNARPGSEGPPHASSPVMPAAPPCRQPPPCEGERSPRSR